LWRDAARARQAEGRTRGLRGDTEERAEPARRLCGRSNGGAEGRRDNEGAGILQKGRRDRRRCRQEPRRSRRRARLPRQALIELAMRILALTLLGVLASPAAAETRQVIGYAGVLGEWELSADVTEARSGEFSGPAT